MTIATSVVLAGVGICVTIALAALHLSTTWGRTLQKVEGLVGDVTSIKEAVGNGKPGTLARRDEVERIEESLHEADERIETHLRSTDARVEVISKRTHDLANRATIVEGRVTVLESQS